MQTVNVLVVDDESVVCKGCKLILSERGYAVDTCTSGEKGLRMAVEDDYDLLMLDMKLPDLNGLEILGSVRKKKPGMKVIVMTGYSTVHNAVEAMKLGACDYLSKPFTDDELAIAANKAIENKRLKEENLSLRKQLFKRYEFDNIVGEHPKILRVFDEVKKVAPTESTVLLEGESGTGKELFARAIHAHSNRATRHFIAADCSTFSPGILESELFGHVQGAFTGAGRDKAGIFQEADGGTLFLDEIANLSMEIQGKLLRVLETHEFKPVGAAKFSKTNVRIITATNRDLKAEVDKGMFREDLFYRLNVFSIYLPPLRERKDDVPKLAYHFLRSFCRKTGKQIEGFSDDALELLVNHDWPGNVRQLKNIVERVVIMADRPHLDSLFLSEQLNPKKSKNGNRVPENLNELKAFKKALLETEFGQMEKAFIVKALITSNWNITHAAEKVGMQRSNFHALIKKHDISVNRIKEISQGRKVLR